MNPSSEHRWMIRVGPWPQDSVHCGWYAGYGGLVRLRIVQHREDAHRFVDLADAVRTKDNLLRQRIADHIDIEDD